MNKETIKNRIKEYKEGLPALEQIVKEYVQNKENSLDDRWNLFIYAGLGEHQSWYHKTKGIDWNKYSLVNDFYLEKYETITAESFVEMCEDMEIDKDHHQINIEEVKEDFLDNFLWQFKFDW